AIKEQRAATPGDGAGFGLLRHLHPTAAPLLAGHRADVALVVGGDGTARATGPRLARVDATDDDTVADRWLAAVDALAAEVAAGAGGLTPSDVPLTGLDQAAIAAVEQAFAEPVEDIWPLSPLQEGL